MKLLFNGLEKKRQTAAGLAQLVERLTVEREVTGSIPGAGLLLRVHVLRNEATAFAIYACKRLDFRVAPMHHIKWRSRLQ